MAASDFHRRRQIHTRERPTSTDLNEMQFYIGEMVRTVTASMFSQAGSAAPTVVPGDANAGAQGFAAPYQSFAVVKDPGNPPFGVLVQNGFGIARTGPASATNIDNANGADYLSRTFLGAPLVLSADQQFTVPAPPTVGDSRIDIIEVRPQYTATDPATVGIFNTATEVFDPATRNKSLTWDLAGLTGTVNSPSSSTACISYKVGQSAAGGITSATEPSTTSGYIKIARINVVGGVALIEADDICDMRPLLFPNGICSVRSHFSIPGIAAGVGTVENVYTVCAPPGVTVKIAYQNNVAPSAGSSYQVQVFIFGGNLTPGTLYTSSGVNYGGVASATPAFAIGSGTTNTIIAKNSAPAIGAMDATVKAILDGSNANWTVLNGTHDFAIGQPYVNFTITLYHSSGSALQNIEGCVFDYTLSMA